MSLFGKAVRSGLDAIAHVPGMTGMIAGFGRLAQAGTTGYSKDIKRRLMILNVFACLIVVTTIIFALQFGLTEGAAYRPLVYINLAIAALISLVPLMHRINDIAGGLLIVVTEYIAIPITSPDLGREGGSQLLFVVAAAAPFFVFGLNRLKLVIAVVIGGLALHLFVWFSYPEGSTLITPEPRILNDLYTQSVITTFGLISVTVWYAFRLAENAKAETDRLLRNVLPDKIVERLRSEPDLLVADTFDSATILFSDISGFVPLARSIGAARVVDLLNTIVCEFDQIAERYGVEKIKTIGDAYMAAAGIPEPVLDHAERMARMALDMLACIGRLRKETGLDIAIRVGIASGPVMAGVIGTQKFSYDVWGDAVNLASRLENRSMPGRILVGPVCQQKLEHVFTFESRGEIEIKGVGLQETFFLTGEKVR